MSFTTSASLFSSQTCRSHAVMSQRCNDFSSLALIPLVKEHVDERWKSVGSYTRIRGGGTHWGKCKYLKEPEKAGGLSTRLGSVKLTPGQSEAFCAKSDLFTLRANAWKYVHPVICAGETGRRWMWRSRGQISGSQGSPKLVSSTICFVF